MIEIQNNEKKRSLVGTVQGVSVVPAWRDDGVAGKRPHLQPGDYSSSLAHDARDRIISENPVHKPLSQ